MENRKNLIVGCAHDHGHGRMSTFYMILLLTIIVQMCESTEIEKNKRSLICTGENLGPNASPECKALNEEMKAAWEKPKSVVENDPLEKSDFSKALDLMREVGRLQEEEYRRQREEERNREYANRNSYQDDNDKEEKYRNKIMIWPYVLMGVFLVVGITIAVVCYMTYQRNNSQPSYSIPAAPPAGYVPPYDTQVQSGFIPSYAATGYVPSNQPTSGITNTNSTATVASQAAQAPTPGDGADISTHNKSVPLSSAPPHDEDVEHCFLPKSVPGSR